MFTCVILTKNPLLEKTFVESIGKFVSLEVIDILFDQVTATERLNHLHPDILFVDVDDPEIGLLDFSEIGNPPGAAFAITSKANSDQILTLLNKGFFDLFILPQFTFELFCRKINKMLKCLYYLLNAGKKPQVKSRDIIYSQPPEPTYKEGMFVRHNKTSVKIKFADILYIKNSGNVLKIHLNNNKIILHNSTLRRFIKSLPPDQFIRINNSTIVNHTRIEEYSRNSVYVASQLFSVTKSYLEDLRKVLRL